MGRQGRRKDTRARSATRRTAAAGLLGGLVTGLAGGVVPGLAGPATAATTAATAAAPADPSTPLSVELDDIVPGELPRSGRVEVTGSVTNDDEEEWRQVKLYTFIGADPIDDAAELDEAALTPEDLLVGDRVLDETATDLVEVLAPGESASFSLSVPSRLLLEEAANGAAEPEPGVYWFGVHALGESAAGRDEFTDGRARTFLPLMPEEVADPLPVSLVVPLRTPVSYAADGSVEDTTGWAQRLGLGGSLRDRLDFGAAAGGSDEVSWLVDPAVVEAVTQLAGANPPRSLAPTDGAPGGGGGEEQDPQEDPPADPGATDGTDPDDLDYSGTTLPAPDPADDASAIPSEDPDASEEPGTVPPTTGDTSTTEAAERALAWLDRFQDVTGGDEVLALPYGDVDVAAALEQDPRAYLEARRRTSAALRSLLGGADPVPVVAPPDGFLTAAEIAALDERDPASLLLGSDAMVQGLAPSLATVGDRDVVLASDGASSGGPGPTDALTSLALRQRILAEAALRLVDADEASAALAATVEEPTVAAAGTTDGATSSGNPSAGPGGTDVALTRAPDPVPTVDPEPLVVVMPDDWDAQSGGDSFFTGLGDAGLDLVPLSGAAQQDGVSVRADDLVAPPETTAAPLPGGAFSAAGALRRSGVTLQNLLTGNSRVASVVAGEALTTLGYDGRADPGTARDQARSSTAWIRERLGAVTVDAPPGITLSGGTGDFSATVVNGLDEPVTVGVQAVVDGGITVRTPEAVEIGPDARTTVLIETSDTSPGVHNVELRVVDVDGRVLPSSDSVPIRSSQVSNVIWVIIATGVGLLVVAVVLRAVRRVRGRGHPPEAVPEGRP